MPLAKLTRGIKQPPAAAAVRTQEPNVTGRPVTVAEVRAFTTWNSDCVNEADMGAYIDAAVDLVERFTHRSLITQKYKLIYDAVLFDFFSVPDVPRIIELPHPPIRSLDSIKYFEEDDTEHSFALSNVYVDTNSSPGRVALRPGNNWPTGLRSIHGIEFNYTSGYGGVPLDVPAALRQAVSRILATHLEHREDAISGTIIQEVPMTAEVMMRPFVVWTL